MKKVNKILTIAKSITTEPDVSKEILNYRREICNTCDFNSNNTLNEDLDTLGKARKKLLKDKPFCTACGCQINEKTSRSTEECGLSEKGIRPKWKRITLETSSRMDLNLINKSIEDIDIDLTIDNRHFKIDYGEINKGSVKEVEFLIQSKSGVKFDLTKFRPSCGSCTKASYERVDNKTYRATVLLNTSNMISGTFKKTIYLTYYLNNVSQKCEIKLQGNTI